VRWLLVVLLVLVLTAATAAACKGPLGRSTSNAETPGRGRFIEKTAPQIRATDAYCSFGVQPHSTSVAASTTRFYIGYMTYGPAGGCGSATGPHGLRVQAYDYTTGKWTLSPQIDTVRAVCCEGHDAPSTFRDPATGQLLLVWGAITAGVHSQLGPFISRSINADDISAWHVTTRGPTPGGTSEPMGGYDHRGTLHWMGQHQVGRPNGTDYARVFPDGSQDSAHRLIGCDVCAFTNGAPQGQTVAVRGAVIHHAWHATLTADGSVPPADVYYVRSTDGGNTWCAANGITCFSRASGLHATFSHSLGRYEWPTEYRVLQGPVEAQSLAVDGLSDGTPLVAVRRRDGSFLFRWNGSAWTETSIDRSATRAFGLAMAVTSTNKILVYGPAPLATQMNEWASRDRGATRVKTVLYATGSTIKRWPNASVFADLGGKERVIVTWMENDNGVPNNLGVIDRPQ
jgi:hypothetical protein